MKKRYIVLTAVCFFSIMLLSEAIYTYKNKWLFYSYVLKTAKIINSRGYTNTAFNIITLGKIKSSNNANYNKDVKNILLSLPLEHNLPTTVYFMALASYKNNIHNLTSELLGYAIDLDPDLSFWRVELANYYLLTDNITQARATLENCTILEAPRQHCLDFLNTNLINNKPEPFGFLVNTINDYHPD